MTDKLPDVVRDLFTAIDARDAEALGRCLAEQAEYHSSCRSSPPSAAPTWWRTSPRSWSNRARSSGRRAFAQNGRHVFVERIDRFWFGAHEAFTECTGVMDLDDDGLITAVRDHVDLATWRERKAAALTHA